MRLGETHVFADMSNSNPAIRHLSISTHLVRQHSRKTAPTSSMCRKLRAVETSMTMTARNRVNALWASVHESKIYGRVPQRHNLLSPSDLYEHILCDLSSFRKLLLSAYTRLDHHYSDSETNGTLRDRTLRLSRAYNFDVQTNMNTSGAQTVETLPLERATVVTAEVCSSNFTCPYSI